MYGICWKGGLIMALEEETERQKNDIRELKDQIQALNDQIQGMI